MELTEGVSFKYSVDSVKHAVFLVNSVKSLPGRIELSDLVMGGSKPKLYVMETDIPPGQVLLRPHNCRIVDADFGDAEILLETDVRFRVQFEGIIYHIEKYPLQ